MNSVDKEILLIAQEECAEVTQAISKVFRFGFDGLYNGNTDKQRLEEEIGDLMAMIELMIENDIVDKSSIQLATGQKKIKLKTWSKIYES